jgi:hypothetical protein
MVLVMRFFLSIRGGLGHFIAPFCRSTKCFGHVCPLITPGNSWHKNTWPEFQPSLPPGPLLRIHQNKSWHCNSFFLNGLRLFCGSWFRCWYRAYIYGWVSRPYVDTPDCCLESPPQTFVCGGIRCTPTITPRPYISGRAPTSPACRAWRSCPIRTCVWSDRSGAFARTAPPTGGICSCPIT